MHRYILVSLFVLFWGSLAQANDVLWYSSASESETEIDEIVQEIPSGAVVLLGEVHSSEIHHDLQAAFIDELARQHKSLNLGMEFFDYTSQGLVDQYLVGEVSEEKFLKQINWSKRTPFRWYKEQVLKPLGVGGWTFGINAPRSLTNKVFHNGLDSLTPSEKELLPPQFELGRSSYKERFIEVIEEQHGGGENLPEAMLKRFWQAQSIWDDTMAWQVRQTREQEPETTYVVIVGEFHVAYGGGLPDRLLARGERQLVTVSQRVVPDGEPFLEWIQENVDDPEHGSRSDYQVFVQ